jgi:uncharacterized protein (DUF2336 family)
MRDNLTEDVAAALVDAGGRDVIVTLLNNHDARISELVLDYLAEESRRIDPFRQPLVRRPDLPRTIAAKMYEWVSDELKGYIAERFVLSTEELEQALHDSVTEITLETTGEAGAAERLVTQLRDRGKLNTELVLRSLQQGQISLFEAALAEMSGISRTAIQRLVYQGDGNSLAHLAKAISISRSNYLLIFQAIRTSRETGGRLSKEETVSLSKLFDEISPEAVELRVQRWRRQTD